VSFCAMTVMSVMSLMSVINVMSVMSVMSVISVFLCNECNKCNECNECSDVNISIAGVHNEFPLKTLHPRNTPNRETQISRYFAVQIQSEILV